MTARNSLTGWEAELIDQQPVARLGTNGPRGWPHLVPVCYALLNGAFYIPIDEKPKAGGTLARVANLTRDGKATLLVDRYDDAWEQLAWVRIECSATVLERGDSQPEALLALRHRYHQYQRMALEERELIVLTPERIVSWHWGR